MKITHLFSGMTRLFTRANAGITRRRDTHPARDWLIGLGGVTVIFFGSIGAAGYLFWQTSAKGDREYGVAIETVVYDHTLVERVLATYRTREERYESLREDGVLPVGDTAPESAKATTTPLVAE